MAEKAQQKAQRVTRKLAQPHTHRGVLHPKGAKVELLPHQEKFLEEREKLEPKTAGAERD